MNYSFLLYLLIFAPILIFFLWITKDRVLKDEPTYLEYALGILIVLVIWDELGIQLKHWYYTSSSNIGLMFGTHPLEIIISAIVFPLFIISVWEFVKRQR